MGDSIPTKVQFIRWSDDGRSIEYIRDFDTPYPQEEDSPISRKAAKKLEDAVRGDFIEVVWAYYDKYPYPISKAKMITGSVEELRGRVDSMEERLARAERVIAALLPGGER